MSNACRTFISCLICLILSCSSDEVTPSDLTEPDAAGVVPDIASTADIQDRGESCSSVDGVVLEIDGESFCAPENLGDVPRQPCPTSHPIERRIADIHICAASDNPVDLLGGMDTACEAASETKGDCESIPGCQFVSPEGHYRFANGECEATGQPICVFTPDRVGNVLMCMTRKSPDSEALEVVRVDDARSPTWNFEGFDDDAAPACQCIL